MSAPDMSNKALMAFLHDVCDLCWLLRDRLQGAEAEEGVLRRAADSIYREALERAEALPPDPAKDEKKMLTSP